MSQTIYITTNEAPSQQVAITVDPSGPMGLSAYQVWLSVGNTGTEQDFLDDLQATQINSDWNATAGVARILNKPTLGTASAANVVDFATASQGTLASTAIQPAGLNSALALKVDKITGKQLSTEDYTTEEKTKLAGIATGAEVNVNPDWNATAGDAQILNKPTTVGGFGITDAVINQSGASAIVCLTRAQYDALPSPIPTIVYILTN